jgi:hypothetical protein
MDAGPRWMPGHHRCGAGPCGLGAAEARSVKRPRFLTLRSRYAYRKIYRIELRSWFDFKLPALARPIKSTNEG